MFVLTHFAFILVGDFYFQRITNHNSEVFEKAWVPIISNNVIVLSLSSIEIRLSWDYVPTKVWKDMYASWGQFFVDRYDTQWYMAPVQVQKLLLFIMQNTTKLYVLHVAHLLEGSMENFTKVGIQYVCQCNNINIRFLKMNWQYL